MVTGSTNGPTYRLGIFIDTLLQPLAISYCGTELLKDTTTFLQKVEQSKEILTESGMNVCTLDFDALYPSIREDLALTALSHALDKSSQHSDDLKLMIIEFTKFCIENSVAHYKGKWYLSLKGISI